MKQLDKRQIVGWIAVGLSIIITCFWAFWGIIETFHEGWYYESLLSNLGLMFVQYLSPMLIFMGVTLISVYWPRFGGGLHVLFAILAAWFFTTPDKESPLWNAHSQVIYWWTATEVDEEHAYIIVYDGKVWRRAKQFNLAYLGFRCIK